MYRADFYQFTLLFGILMGSGCLRGEACVNREDVYKSPKAPPISIYIPEFPDIDVIPIGYNLTIVCTGNISREGEQPKRVQLFFNGDPIKQCGGFPSDREDSKTCKHRIEKASVNSSGQYGCMVLIENLKCSVAFLALKLREPSNPRFVVHPIAKDNTVKGKLVNFSCEALGVPRPDVAWFKDGRRIPQERIKEIKALSMLTIKSVEPQDEGQYWCEANSNEGWNRSAVANLTVVWKPVFSIHPEDALVDEGSDAIFKCAADGSPRPKVSWLKNNSLLTNLSVTQNGSVSKLVLHSVANRQSNGMYKCVAINPAGRTTSNAGRLTVVSKAANTPTASTSQRIENVHQDEHSSSTLTTVLATAGSVVAVIILVSLVVILRRFWRKQEILKPDAEEDDNQEEFLLVNIGRDACPPAQPMDEETGLGSPEADQSTRFENEDDDNETYLKEMGIDRNWQIPREKLEITEERLGRGAFAVVNKGFYRRRDGKKLPVAVKILKDNNNQTERLALISEIETLAKVGRHPNIVSLVGACTFEEPLCLVVEFVPGGSLIKLLRRSQVQRRVGEDNPLYANIWSRLSERELLQIAADIANGMRHLESKLCIHRDLAARNILVGKGLIAKVADFGMARDVSKDGEYIKTTEGKIPWLWMPMESLRGRFTTMADVWSFGVLLWEIVTLGKRPYEGVEGLVELYNKLKDGERLEKPSHCSEELYRVMTLCWQNCPEERPTFKKLYVILHDILNTKSRTYINVQYFEEKAMITDQDP